jgi:hypothetical protein
MKVEMRLNQIQFFDKNPLFYGDSKTPVYPGADGMAEYEVTVTRTEEEMKALEPGSLNPWKTYLHHPFQHSGLGKTSDGRNIWAWDGSREAPTLTPSFGCLLIPQPRIYIHIYLTVGKIIDSGSEGVIFL